MYKYAEPFFLQVISPLHAGSGTEVGVIDLPIQRERHTGFPKIEGSSLKGAIREAFEERCNKNVKELIKVHKIFGYDPDEATPKDVKKFFDDLEKVEFAGALGFSDARLLLFPVKAMKGVYAYITCPQVLKTFKNDLSLCGIPLAAALPSVRDLQRQDDQSVCLIADEAEVAIDGTAVVLEEYTFTVNPEKNSLINELAKPLMQYTSIAEIPGKLVVLADEDFRDFVEMSTEVITRTKIESATGTVKGGALFTEEYLPAESVLYALALATPLFLKDKDIFPQSDSPETQDEARQVMTYFKDQVKEPRQYLQIGGNATIGKGLVRVKTYGGETS